MNNFALLHCQLWCMLREILNQKSVTIVFSQLAALLMVTNKLKVLISDVFIAKMFKIDVRFVVH